MREFREETGFVARGPFVAVTPVCQKSGKTGHAFAFEGDFDPAGFSGNTFEMQWPPRTGRRMRFPEVDRIEWFGAAAALERIIAYPRPLVRELLDKLNSPA